MIKVTYSGSIVQVGGVEISLPYDVLDAYENKGVVVVLIDPDSYIGKEKGLRNIVAYDVSGKKLWDANFPQRDKPDYYWKISNRTPLVVKSFSSYECEIDLITGKVLKANFYK